MVHSCHNLVSLPSCHEDLAFRNCCWMRVSQSVTERAAYHG